MKHIVISLPAMGKTTLVKAARALNWDDGKGVDFDLKGLNHYSSDLSVSCTVMCNDMFAAGKQFITAFNGCINFHVLDDDVDVYFVGPATATAMNAAVTRAYKRGDSAEFVDTYASHVMEWSLGLYQAYLNAKSVIGESRCHYVGIRNLEVLSDVFSLKEDGSLSFNGYASEYRGKFIFPKFAHHPHPCIDESELVNPIDDQIRKFASYLSGPQLTDFLDELRYSQCQIVRLIPYLDCCQLDADRSGHHVTFIFVNDCDERLDEYTRILNQFNDESCDSNGWYVHVMNERSISARVSHVSYDVEYHVDDGIGGTHTDCLKWKVRKDYFIFAHDFSALR